jgi:hypothetical protein
LERASDGAPGPAIGATDFTGQRVGDRPGAAVHVISSFGVDDDLLNSLMHEEAMEPKAVSAGLVARQTWAFAGSPKRSFAFLISLTTKLVQRAGTVQIRGG